MRQELCRKYTLDRNKQLSAQDWNSLSRYVPAAAMVLLVDQSCLFHLGSYRPIRTIQTNFKRNIREKRTGPTRL